MPTYRNPEEPTNALHRLLLKCVPTNEHGNKTIMHLAAIYPLRRWSVNKWIRQEKIPAHRVARLIEIGRIGEPDGSPGRVKLEDFHPFVYKD